MGLGERIRQARQEKAMSQRQLCGEEITRNMLSLIENGSARPSMDTLCYLAERLEKPVSWFLDEEAAVSANQHCMAQARELYTMGQYRQAAEALESYREPDALFDWEHKLLTALCAMGEAERALTDGKTVYGADLLEKAWEAGEKTPYFTCDLRRRWVLLMSRTGQKKPGDLARQLPEEDEALLLRGEAALELGDPERAAACLEAVEQRNGRWNLLRGRGALMQKAYSVAAAYFREAEREYPRECAVALETCYRELEDYKMAYIYACKLREL